MSIIERVNASFTCIRWPSIYKLTLPDIRSFYVNNKLFYEYIQHNASVNKFTAFIVSIIKKCGAHLNSISLINYLGDKETNISINTFKILSNIARYCKNITHFILLNSEVFDCDKKLRVLESSLESLFIKNEKIRKLHLDNLYLSGNFLSKLQPNAIEELTVDNCYFQLKQHYCDFISQLKNIKKFHIQNSQCVTALRALNKSNCESISDFHTSDYVPVNEFSSLLFKKKNLKKLSIAFSKIDYNFLDNLPKENLEYLNLSLTENLAHYSCSKISKFKIINYGL